ncbi:Cysteine and glycine-rich protein 3 [Mycena sanguinolenta]|uniref:Cysteine and glycine-rich protein 3 n=1 Tax=Mycena sanguinolenta TaxID=230812 RepID=A0A8H7DIG0_9AGAR|nr:Cysteine and glycine-rich protein 3 [Mycena sanguinolenta]
MASFGGSAICPKCTKSVYAAEQVLGPGRKFYHKPCLACMTCNKRLDSFTLLEHDQEPYCKSCHAKNFGTHNISNRPDPLRTPPRKRPTADTSEESPSPLSGTPSNTGRFGAEALPRTVQLSPTRAPDSPDDGVDADDALADLNTSGYSSRAMAPIAERYASAAMVQRRHMTGDGESPPRPVARTLTGGSPSPRRFGGDNPKCALREERVFC